MIEKIINQLAANPKRLFLIDSIGALITTILLSVVVKQFNEYIGMPATTLTYLSIVAGCFCVYSASCFFFLKHRWTPFIQGIGIANLLYCFFTIVLMIRNYPLLTVLGITYFVGEIAIILGLIYIEFQAATAIKLRKTAKSLK